MTNKEKFEEAKKLYQTANADQKYFLEILFPELTELEDERIRKVLIDYFKSYREVGSCGSETFNGIPTDNVLAWLEKQGKQKKDFREKYDKIADSEWFKKTHENMSVDMDEPNGETKEQVDGFDAELNALLKKYEYLPKEELAECLEFYLGVVNKSKAKMAEINGINNGWNYQNVMQMLQSIYEVLISINNKPQVFFPEPPSSIDPRYETEIINCNTPNKINYE